MYTSGLRIESGQFSNEMVGEMITDYGINARLLSNRRWSKLLHIIRVAQGYEDRQLAPNAASSMQRRRRMLYVRSSDGPTGDE
jgi:hypothetical protein